MKVDFYDTAEEMTVCRADVPAIPREGEIVSFRAQDGGSGQYKVTKVHWFVDDLRSPPRKEKDDPIAIVEVEKKGN